jgi:hypothetical protein
VVEAMDDVVGDPVALVLAVEDLPGQVLAVGIIRQQLIE